MSRAGWDKRRKASAARLGATDEVKDAYDRLRRAPRPLAAALAMAAVRDPGIIDASIERVGSHGFGDEQLDRLAQELVSLRYEADGLEADAAVRHLHTRGFVPEDFTRLERDAQRAGLSAPFLTETGERARDLWRQAFDLLMQLESLERAVEGAAQDLARDQDSATLMTLKGERDQLRRLLNSDWANENVAESPLAH
jgi:DNA primase